MHAAVDELVAAGNAEHLVAALARLRPHRAALAGAVHDPVRHAAQRDHCARLKRRRLRQAAETGVSCRLLSYQKRRRRQGDERGLCPTRIEAKLEPIELDLAAVFDFERGLGRADLLKLANSEKQQTDAKPAHQKSAPCPVCFRDDPDQTDPGDQTRSSPPD